MVGTWPKIKTQSRSISVPSGKGLKDLGHVVDKTTPCYVTSFIKPIDLVKIPSGRWDWMVYCQGECCMETSGYPINSYLHYTTFGADPLEQSRGWNQSPSLSIIFGLSSRRKGGLIRWFHQLFTALPPAGGGTTKRNSNDHRFRPTLYFLPVKQARVFRHFSSW